MAKPHIVMINASLAGDTGNTSFVLARARQLLVRRAKVTTITLGSPSANHSSTPARYPKSSAPTASSDSAAPSTGFSSIRDELANADAFIFGTGTHWDSWSSVLQKFLEDATPAEGTKLWLGKPAAVVVSEHSVGGKGVLTRLQGVLVTLGCIIPPMSGLVLSRAALIAVQHDAQAANDFWCRGDLAVVCHNLVESAAGTARWKTWPVDRTDFTARWA